MMDDFFYVLETLSNIYPNYEYLPRNLVGQAQLYKIIYNHHSVPWCSVALFSCSQGHR
jgi:hypothetical protein